MPIPFNQKLKEVNGTVRLNLPNLASDKTWVAWWYCGIQKNKKAEAQPHVLVAFREFVDGGLSDNHQLQSVLLEALGQVRIGSVWKDGCCTHQAQFDTALFDVDFTYRAWKTTSFLQASREKVLAPYPPNLHKLDYPNDTNWLLEFPLTNDGKLVVPCLEFFTRCYGASGELKRVLATYPWRGADKAHESKLYAPLDEGEVDDGSVWKVKLRKRLYDKDVLLLAHAKYDKSYCEKVVKRIYDQIEEQYDPTNYSKPKPLKVAPWFQGKAQISVRGVWFDDNKSFVGLQILGCSEPNGIDILRDRANTNKTNLPADEIDKGNSWNGAPQRIINPPEIIDLTGDLEPDHSAPIVEIQDPDFEVLGKERVVRDAWRARAKGSGGVRKQSSETTVFATGEPHGDGKGVGYASINAKPVMDSKGALSDMWNAMRHLKAKYPTQITAVEWFTFKDGYQSTDTPNLIALNPYADKLDKSISGTIRNWPYFDVKSKALRGILVMRMAVNGNPVHIIEIQRRPRNIEVEQGEKMAVEESYTGFVFMADSQAKTEETITYFMDRVRAVEGVVKKLLISCPVSEAHAFQHKTAELEDVNCENAVLKALNKVSISFL